MSKKKNSKSVIITVIVTLIVLAGLTFAGIKFLLPIYAQGQNGAVDVQYEVYKFAVKIFPLIVGIVLIIIASMIATSKDDEEDEEDKLPPNSYEKQLFEQPADDPEAKAVPEEEQPVAEEVAPEEKEEFASIFDGEEEAPAEETEETEETEEPEEEEETQQNKLVDALYALVDKLDEMTDVYGYEDYTYDDHDNDEIPEETEEEEEEEHEEDQSPLENKIDKLCDAIASLTTLVAKQATQPVVVAAAPAPVAEPAKEEEPVKEEAPCEEAPCEEAPVEEEPAPAVEPQIIEKPVEVPVPVEKIVEVPVEKEVEVDKVLNDTDASDPIQRAKIEYESAKESNYDISFAVTEASLEDVQLSLGDFADSYLVNGKTVVIIPFLDKKEARDELDKIGAPYDVTTIVADDDADFDKTIAPMFA